MTRFRTLGMLLMLAVVSVLLVFSELLNRSDHLFYDLQSGLWSRPPADEIRIIGIDEASLTALGRWPWSRNLHTALIEKLSTAGVRAVGLDIIFAEPEQESPEADKALADAIRGNGRVVLPILPAQDPDGGLRELHPLPILEHSPGHLTVRLSPATEHCKAYFSLPVS